VQVDEPLAEVTRESRPWWPLLLAGIFLVVPCGFACVVYVLESFRVHVLESFREPVPRWVDVAKWVRSMKDADASAIRRDDVIPNESEYRSATGDLLLFEIRSDEKVAAFQKKVRAIRADPKQAFAVLTAEEKKAYEALFSDQAAAVPPEYNLASFVSLDDDKSNFKRQFDCYDPPINFAAPSESDKLLFFLHNARTERDADDRIKWWENDKKNGLDNFTSASLFYSPLKFGDRTLPLRVLYVTYSADWPKIEAKAKATDFSLSDDQCWAGIQQIVKQEGHSVEWRVLRPITLVGCSASEARSLVERIVEEHVCKLREYQELNERLLASQELASRKADLVAMKPKTMSSSQATFDVAEFLDAVPKAGALLEAVANETLFYGLRMISEISPDNRRCQANQNKSRKVNKQ
jgi:hypothetical protein